MGALKQTVIDLDAFRGGQFRQPQMMARRNESAAVPNPEHIWSDAHHVGQMPPASKLRNQIVDVCDRVHGSPYLPDANTVKRIFLAWWCGMVAATRRLNPHHAQINIPPRGREHTWSRLAYVAVRDATTPTELSRMIGRENNSWISSGRSRGLDLPYEMLSFLRARYGITYDWMIDGEDSGLTVPARKFLGLGI